MPWCQFITLTRAANPEDLMKRDETSDHAQLAEKMRARREQREQGESEDPGVPPGY